jgi:hypothetical protein
VEPWERRQAPSLSRPHFGARGIPAVARGNPADTAAEADTEAEVSDRGLRRHDAGWEGSAMSTTLSDPKQTGLASLAVEIQLDRISLMGDTQPRTEINQFLVDEYAEAYKANADFPPIVVFFDGATYWLVDGFHRRWAAIKANLKALPCIVHQGTLEDARWYSYAANQTHGLRRSNEDKAKAVRQALQHPKGAGLSDSAIAEYVGVSHPFVGKIRKQLESESSLETVTSRKGKDGRSINTANIGKKPKKKADDDQFKPTGACPRGGEHEWVEDEEDRYCAKCKDPGDPVDDQEVDVNPKESPHFAFSEQMRDDLSEIVRTLNGIAMFAVERLGKWPKFPSDHPLVLPVKNVWEAIYKLNAAVQESGALEEDEA